jgi:hypothetical protein
MPCSCVRSRSFSALRASRAPTGGYQRATSCSASTGLHDVLNPMHLPLRCRNEETGIARETAALGACGSRSKTFLVRAVLAIRARILRTSLRNERSPESQPCCVPAHPLLLNRIDPTREKLLDPVTFSSRFRQRHNRVESNRIGPVSPIMPEVYPPSSRSGWSPQQV